MTLSDYFLLFDLVAGTERHTSLYLTGDVAGAALRAWGVARGRDVEPERVDSLDLGYSWTALKWTDRITVALDDKLWYPGREPEPELSSEEECPF